MKQSSNKNYLLNKDITVALTHRRAKDLTGYPITKDYHWCSFVLRTSWNVNLDNESVSIKRVFVLFGIRLLKLLICSHCIVCLLDLVKLCKCCDFRSEVYLNYKFKTVILSSVICSGSQGMDPSSIWVGTSSVWPEIQKPSKRGWSHSCGVCQRKRESMLPDIS